MRNIEKQTGELIRLFIKYRNKSMKETADAVGINYKTFSAQLNNGSVSVATLFALSDYLDINLNWMLNVLKSELPEGLQDIVIISRMSGAYREKVKPALISRMDILLEEYTGNTVDVRRSLMSEFDDFFLLDALVPEDYTIAFSNISGRSKFMAERPLGVKSRRNTLGSRLNNNSNVSIAEAIDTAIEERKDNR